MSASYQWPAVFPGLTIDRKADPYAVALIARPVLLLLLTSLGYVGRRYAVRRGGLAAPKSVVAFLVLFPLASGMSLFVKFLSGQYCLRDAAPGFGGDCGVPGAVCAGNFSAHFRYVGPNALWNRDYVYQGGPDYAPFWGPWAFVLLWIVLAGAIAAWLKALRANPARPDAP